LVGILTIVVTSSLSDHRLCV